MELYSIEFKSEKEELEAENAVIDISIVSKPSHDVNGLCFSKELYEFSRISEGKYLALLLRADYPIYRPPNPDMPNGGYVQFSTDFIKKIQETNHAKKAFSFQHDKNKPINAQLIENWIVTDTLKDKTACYGIEASPGSWAGVLKFETDSDFERAKEMQGGISLGFDPRLVGFKKIEQNAEKNQVSFKKIEENNQISNQIKDDKKMNTKITVKHKREHSPSRALKFEKPSAFREKLLSNAGFLSKIDSIAKDGGKSINFASEADVILENADVMANELANAMAVEIVDEIVKVADEVMTAELAPLEQALAENEALKSELEALKSELEALKSSSATSTSADASTQFSAQEVEELKKKNEDLEAIVAEKSKSDLNFSEHQRKIEPAIYGKTQLDI